MKRALNPQKADGRVILQLGDTIILKRLSLVLPDQIEAGAVVGREEGSAYRVRPGFDRDGDGERPVGLALHSLGQPDPNVIKQVHALAVNEQFQLFAGDIFPKAEILDGKFVFAVGREAMMHHHSTASAKRQTLDMLVL